MTSDHEEAARLREGIASFRQRIAKIEEGEFLTAFPWLADFQAGWDRVPSADTLDEARRDFQDIFFNGGIRQVTAFLSWLRPERMSLASFDCLLGAADLAGVRLPQWKRDRDRVEEILGARVRHGR